MSIDYHAFKKITDYPIVLNFSKCNYLGEVHKELKEKFGLPEYYGENWDALWDCLEYLIEDQIKVRIIGYKSMPKNLKEECRKMFRVFDDVHNRTPNFSYEIIS